MVNHPGSIIPGDSNPDDTGNEVLAELPFSHDEVNELLYGADERPATERLDRLRELADGLRARHSADISNDVRSLLAEVENAIGEIEAGERMGGQQGGGNDPADHRETLSPDSDELEALEEADEADMAAPRRLDGVDKRDVR